MNMKIKILGVAAAAVLVVHSAMAEEKTLPLAEARAQIGSIVEDPVSMTSVMKQLAPADQTAFLADVNAAISKMPGSSEEKAAKFLNVNKAALKGSAKGNLANLVAEVFATVPVDALTLVSERFAEDLFNRSSDPSRRYTDDAFRNIAEGLLEKIMARTAGTDDAAVRNALAIAMLVRASNGTVEDDLFAFLVSKLPNEADRELTRNEWGPAALSSDKPDYEAMLAYAGAGSQPEPVLALQLAGPQLVDAFLADVSSSIIDNMGRDTTPFTDQMFSGFKDPVVHSVEGTGVGSSAVGVGDPQPPRTDDPTKSWNPSKRRNDPQPRPVPEPEPEPVPYE